jgi:hypothetical protein
MSLGGPMLDELFKRFVKEKTFLANVSPKTVRFYQQSYKAFKRTMGLTAPRHPDLSTSGLGPAFSWLFYLYRLDIN